MAVPGMSYGSIMQYGGCLFWLRSCLSSAEHLLLYCILHHGLPTLRSGILCHRSQQPLPCSPAHSIVFLLMSRHTGPGAFDFKQGDNNGTLFWKLVRSFIHLPSAEQTACHAPKPILLDTGNINIPYAW